MRYLLALGSLILGLAMLVIGISRITFWADSGYYSATTDAANKSAYAVISGSELAKIPSKRQAVSAGKADGVIAVGALHDIQAWAAAKGFTNITVDAQTKKLKFENVQATPEENLGDVSVADSDLWTQSISAQGNLDLKLNSSLTENQAIMVAAADGVALAEELEIRWFSDKKLPWVGPLLTLGALFTVLGIVLYIMFVENDRRRLGPRRGRRGPFIGIRNSFQKTRQKTVSPIYSKGAKSMLAVGASATLLLSGCAPEYWPVAVETEPSQEQAAARSILTDAQLKRIIEQVVAVSDQADTNLDDEILHERFTGDALAQRASNYKIRKAVSDYAIVPPYLLPERLGYELLQDTESWPRAVFLTLNSSRENPDLEAFKNSPKDESPVDNKAPSLGIFMTQTDPHSNYQVANVFALRGGIQLPEAAPVEEGTAALDNAIGNLQVAPSELAGRYADILVKGQGSEYAQIFNIEGDAVLGRGGESWVKSEQERIAGQDHKANFSVRAEATETKPIALSTGTGGALVAVSINEYRVTEAAEGSQLPVSAVVKSVSDLSGNVHKIEQKVMHQLLFYVPKRESVEKIQLLGSTSELVGANG